MIAVVHLDSELGWVGHHIHRHTLTRKHAPRAVRGHSTTAGGDDTPCGVGRVGICALHPAEVSGGKNACAAAIDRRKVKERCRNPIHSCRTLRLAV